MIFQKLGSWRLECGFSILERILGRAFEYPRSNVMHGQGYGSGDEGLQVKDLYSVISTVCDRKQIVHTQCQPCWSQKLAYRTAD